MVAQLFDWKDQMQALNISGPENAHLAQVGDDAPAEIVAAEDQMMELQYAMMVSSSHEPNKNEVSLPSCSQACIDYGKIQHEKIETLGREVENFKILREHNDLLKREVEDLRYEGYQLWKKDKNLLMPS